MKHIFLSALLAFSAVTAMPAANNPEPLVSPDGTITASLTRSRSGAWTMKTSASGTEMAAVRLGIATDTKKFSGSLTLDSYNEPRLIDETYTNVHGKCSQAHNQANAVTYRMLNSAGDEIDIEVRAYNDGVAFRYIIPGTGAEQLHFTGESTAYTMNGFDRRWLQRFVTSYEGDFPLQEGNPQQGDWNYPALFQKGDRFTLITEAAVDGTYCATHMSNSGAAATYTVNYPFDWEGNGQGNSLPDAVTPWSSPWRVMIMGSIADIFCSTLVEDVCPPSRIADPSWIEPAGAAWVYWAYNNGSRDYQICRQYVDLAVRMGWKYVLIDWEWDVMGNGGNIEDIIAYAASQGVKTMLWYNSGGTHNSVGGGPRDRLLTHESRCREFEYLKRLGVSGIKIDFFESDKQSMMQYYQDILADAADYEMLIVYHGCTVPRGWSRTYPNLMTMEAVFGAEQYNNGETMTQIAPRLNCTLPFTRNVVGPMDYTPVAFTDSQHPHLTSFAHELALSVVFESGVQHWADRPSGFYALPTFPWMHMSAVPTAWDETRLLQGYPGTDCVVARRSGEVWYVGGINGETREKSYEITLDFLEPGRDYMATIIGDGADYDAFSIRNFKVAAGETLTLPVISRGGFAIDIRSIGSADLAALCDKAGEVVAEARSGALMCDAQLLEALEQALSAAADAGDVYAAYAALGDALSAFECEGIVRHGAIADIDAAQNITRHYLGEARNFSRSDTDGYGPRFGTPRDWTVENFHVADADIGGMGDKGGIDRYAGDNTLSLGVWNDSWKATTDISKAKLYRKVTLPAGSYFFGAAYQTVSSDETMYIYAATRPLLCSETKDEAIAYHSLSESHGNGKHYGVYFTADREREFTLGWSADLSSSGQKEFRAREVVLLRLDEPNPAEAIHADPEVRIPVNQFARHLEATNIVDTDGTPLLAMKNHTVEIGQVVMDNVQWLTVSCRQVQNRTSTARVLVYADGSTRPLATVDVTADTDPSAIVVALPQMAGMHNLTMRLQGAEYRLEAVTLSEQPLPGGIDDITAPGASSRNIYRLDGIKVDTPDLPRGIYIINGTKTLVP